MARKIGSRYTANQVLGRGSAGTVWLGEGPDGPVAVKVLREDLAGDQDLVDRFVQESTAITALDHPHVVAVHELVVDDSGLALVMDLVRGTDLRTRLEHERRLAPEAAVAIAADIAEGLAAAHARGLVHRDVKPENVLLDMTAPLGPGGAHPALLTDFGVAQLIDHPRPAAPGAAAQSSRPATKIIGTPDYLAPEIVEGLPPRAAVDIYALATVLYEMLAGFTPFGGGHSGAVLRRHVTETVVPLPGIPEELWQLLVQCLAKAPASRLRASELAGRLREQLPLLAGIPPLAVDDAEDADAAAAADGADGATAPEEPDPMPMPVPAQDDRSRRGAVRRAAVSLVRGAAPDSNRDTHTSMRVPEADELAGGARGTARVPRAAGVPRPGSARHRAAARRRAVLGLAAAVLLAAVGIGTWLATSGDDEAPPSPSTHSAVTP